MVELTEEHPDDVGVVASLFLNHVRIQTGEAVFIAAGVLHSYVRGLGVELMATSDNGLRAGLTPKHVVVQEVLRTASYVAGVPQPLVSEVLGDVSIYDLRSQILVVGLHTPCSRRRCHAVRCSGATQGSSDHRQLWRTDGVETSAPSSWSSSLGRQHSSQTRTALSTSSRMRRSRWPITGSERLALSSHRLLPLSG